MRYSVKIVKRDGQSALVEYLDQFQRAHRVIVPLGAIEDNSVSEDDLSQGIPYGLPWSRLVTLRATSEQLEQELHRVGIWTAEDALKNAEAVRGAIQAAYTVDLATVLRLAKEV